MRRVHSPRDALPIYDASGPHGVVAVHDRTTRSLAAISILPAWAPTARPCLGWPLVDQVR